MVKSQVLRAALIESVVNPNTDVLVREMLQLATPDYLMIRAIEKISLARKHPDSCVELLTEAITLAGCAKVMASKPTDK